MNSEQRSQASIEAIERQLLSIGRDDGALTAEGVDRLRAALAAHADAVRGGRAGGMATRTLADRSAAAVSTHLADIVCPLLLTRFASLMPIADGASAMRGDGEASATDYAEGIAATFAWERAAGPDARLRSAIQGRLGTVSRLCRGRIEAHLTVRSDEDIPDVRLLARDILRVEAVEWAVAIAGGAGQADELRRLAHHAARRAIQWAGKVFERFKADPDEFTHFDAVATLSAVDDLLVVIQRVLEGDRDDRLAGSHPFVLTLGEQALQDFADGLEHMTRRYLSIAEAYLLAGGTQGDFVVSVLQLLQRVLRLGSSLLLSVDLLEIRLNHEATIGRMTEMRDKLRTAVAQTDASGGLAARLAVVESALATVGG